MYGKNYHHKINDILGSSTKSMAFVQTVIQNRLHQYSQMQGENKMPNVQKLNSSLESFQASYGDRSELKVSDNLSSPIQTLNKPIQILNHEQAE
jgi:hypothetical protein